MARQPKNFVIQISLDADQNFEYQDLFSQMDASTITVINGDRIAWVLDPGISNRTLQLDFGDVNPFSIFHSVTLRGNGQVVANKVNFPINYPGNRQLKYTVSVGNGLHDDPDVVPVENDGGLISALILPADFKIDWVDDTFQAITLNPAEVTKNAGAGKASVTWRWDDNQDPDNPTPPFDLDFIAPPNGWPPTTTHSTNPNPVITLSLPPGPRTQFKITTLTGDGSNKIYAYGYLTITNNQS
jgi:hypothetical protein